MRHTFRVQERRIHPVFDERRLMLNGLIYDGIQLVVRHHFQDVRHKFFLCSQEVIVACVIGSAAKAILSVRKHFGEALCSQELVERLERSFGTPADEYLESLLHFVRSNGSRGEQLIQLRNRNRIHHGGARRLKLRNGFVENRCDLSEVSRLWFRRLAHRLPENADACTLQTIPL